MPCAYNHTHRSEGPISAASAAAKPTFWAERLKPKSVVQEAAAAAAAKASQGKTRKTVGREQSRPKEKDVGQARSDSTRMCLACHRVSIQTWAVRIVLLSMMSRPPLPTLLQSCNQYTCQVKQAVMGVPSWMMPRKEGATPGDAVTWSMSPLQLLPGLSRGAVLRQALPVSKAYALSLTSYQQAKSLSLRYAGTG